MSFFILTGHIPCLCNIYPATQKRSEAGTSLFSRFCVQGNHEVSVYTASSTVCLDLIPKSGRLCTLFLHLDSILAPNPQWGNLHCSLLAVGTTQ